MPQLSGSDIGHSGWIFYRKGISRATLMVERDYLAARNRILARINSSSRDALRACGRIVELRSGCVLWEQDSRIAHVYFPLTAIVSVVVKTDDLREMELVTVGNEGLAGVPAAIGIPRSIGRTLIQVSGEAFVVPANALREVAANDAQVSELLCRYHYYFIRMMAQSALCHRFHRIEERCARWLLLTHDRAGTNEFRLTERFLGEMMGTGRSKVNIALLCRHGAIERGYGRIGVRDRGELESLACPCYESLCRVQETVRL